MAKPLTPGKNKPIIARMAARELSDRLVFIFEQPKQSILLSADFSLRSPIVTSIVVGSQNTTTG